MYQADADLNARRISALGNIMKKARDDADYAEQLPRVDEVMIQQLEDANRFLAILAQVPAGSPQLLPRNQPKVCPNCGVVLP